jgi:hypothetical protein
MSHKVKISTMQTKIEFMILSLGGKPDEDQLENNHLLSQFEQTRSEIKKELKQAHGLLMERNETI